MDIPIYHSLTEMITASDLIVAGQVTKIADAIREQDEPGTLPEKSGHGLVTSAVSFHIDRIIRSRSRVAVGDTVTLNQLGGVIDGQRIVYMESSVYTESSAYVLFLVRFADGTYGSLGGDQGAFALSPTGQLIAPGAPTDVDTAITHQLEGKTVDQVDRLVAAG